MKRIIGLVILMALLATGFFALASSQSVGVNSLGAADAQVEPCQSETIFVEWQPEFVVDDNKDLTGYYIDGVVLFNVRDGCDTDDFRLTLTTKGDHEVLGSEVCGELESTNIFANPFKIETKGDIKAMDVGDFHIVIAPDINTNNPGYKDGNCEGQPNTIFPQ